MKISPSFEGLFIWVLQPPSGKHFWDRGYFVSTVGIDEDNIKRYVKYQEEQERKEEGNNTNFTLF